MGSKNNSLREKLWNTEISPQTYESKGKYQDHILEQYKIYVEMADRISSRRNLTNTFFLTLNSILISAIGFALKKMQCMSNKVYLIIPLVAILALCYTWWRLVKSYRQLNTAKYAVIGEMEKQLPSSPWYSAEWKALGEGNDPKRYVPLTHVENWIPIIFGFIYIFVFIFTLLQ